MNVNLQEEKKNINKSLKNLLKINPNTNQKNQIEELIKDMEKDEYTILVLGEFKRGKSTFINALLGESLLPMNVLPETATINILHYGEEPELKIYYQDGHIENGEVSYKFLKQFSAGNKDNDSSNIKYIDINYPLKLLKDNIVLIDTPGVSDLSEARCEITYGIIPTANAVIFLLDAVSPLKETERKFIEEKLLKIGINNILFIANRYDFIDEEEEEDFLDDLKIRIQNAFLQDEEHTVIENIELLPLSASMALEGIELNSSNKIKISGINEVRDKIHNMLQNGIIEAQKIDAYKKRAEIIAYNVNSEIKNQIVLKNTDVNTLILAQEQLKKVITESLKHKDNIAKYIEESKPDMFAMVDKSISYFNSRLQEDVKDMVDGYQGTGFKDFVEITVSKRVKSSFEDWINAYSSNIEYLLKKLEQELSTGMSYYFNQNIQIESEVGREIQASGYKITLNANDVSNVNYKAGIMAAVGGMGLMALFGGAFMPFIGFAALPFLREKMLQDSLARAKAEVYPELMSEIAKSTLNLKNEVHQYVEKRCNEIKTNTEYAYEEILSQIKRDIDMEIANKIQEQTDTKNDIKILEDKTQKVLAELNNFSK